MHWPEPGLTGLVPEHMKKECFDASIDNCKHKTTVRRSSARILGLLREWFPAYREKLENEERMIKQTGDIADVMRSKTHCEPEKYCGSCGNKYSCVETSMTYDGTACYHDDNYDTNYDDDDKGNNDDYG
uniref:DUF3456 domain-containing protein n=1 Tax=Globodera pallida TaxID=36090 RepID=A0A183C199_GLOPA